MDKKILFNNKVILIPIIAFICGLIVFFALRFFTPFGAVVNYQFSSNNDRDKVSKIKGANEVSSFKPSQTGALQIPQQVIKQDIVTFNLKLLSKPIEGVWINLKFKGNPKEIRIGTRGSEKENYQYLPLYNQTLDTLTWNKINEKGTTLWQRNIKYQAISELASNPPASEETRVASYFFDPNEISVISNNVTSNTISKKNFIFDRTLRGSHTVYIRVDTKPLIVTIEKQDNNTYKGEDVLSMELFKGENRIFKKEIFDDGMFEISGLKLKTQIKQIKINNPDLGVYRLVLTDKSNGSDVLIKKITTNQSKLVVATPIYIFIDKPSGVWTNSKQLSMSTWHKEYTQVVKLDNIYDLNIQKENEIYKFDLNHPTINNMLSKNKMPITPSSNVREMHVLDIPKNDLIITGDGYFTLLKDSFFNPEPIKTISLTSLTDINKIDYIIGSYQPIEKQGEWNIAKAYFDPKDIKIDGDKLYFSLESPLLSSYGGEIVIDSLEVTVKKPAWFDISAKVTPAPVVKVEKLNIIQRIIRFFKKIFFGKEEKVIVPPSIPPTEAITPTPQLKNRLKISVLNGGAREGAAKILSDNLQIAGFTNVSASNAANLKYKEALITYVDNDSAMQNVVSEIEQLLKVDYTVIEKKAETNNNGEITIILGKSSKVVTPTPKITGTLITPRVTGSPTVTPRLTPSPTPTVFPTITPRR